MFPDPEKTSKSTRIEVKSEALDKVLANKALPLFKL